MLHYCERLNKLEAETLEMRRLKLDLAMYYNILHGFVDIDAGSLFDTINCNKCKKLQFIHKLTASDTSKTAKITKR